VAGGLALGTDVCSGPVFVGRVAVVFGGFVWATANVGADNSNIAIANFLNIISSLESGCDQPQ
jgi:hypothetical protein